MPKALSRKPVERIARTSDGMRKEYDFSKAVRGKHAEYLRDKRWWVQLDPDLTALLSMDGHPGRKLMQMADRHRTPKKQRGEIVTTIPMTERDYLAIKSLLIRIGAKVTFVPEHPSWAVETPAVRRRKAG